MTYTKISNAQMRGGRPYKGLTQFLGCGMTRSCGRCGNHWSILGNTKQLGSTKHPVLGWVCSDCSKSGKASMP